MFYNNYARENGFWQAPKTRIRPVMNRSLKLFGKREPMKTQKTHRRSERTRRLIGEALVALLLEKRYEDITVQDILDQADVGRSTFYAHYYDKEDLLTSEIERVIDVLSQHMEQAPSAPTAMIPSLGLFQHVQ